MNYAARTDGNHADIRKAFRRLGIAVADTSRLGEGFSDLVISKSLVTALVEVKADAKAKLTAKQREFWDAWQGQIYRCESIADVERIAASLRREVEYRLEGFKRINKL